MKRDIVKIEIHLFCEKGRVSKEFRVFRLPLVYEIKTGSELSSREKKWLAENRPAPKVHF